MNQRRFSCLGLLCVWFGLEAGMLFTGLPAMAQDATATIEKQFLIPETNDSMAGSGPVRRYDWMKQIWQRRRSNFDARTQQDQNAIVFLGDSITQGWGDDFRGDFENRKVANRGISGDTTRGMLFRLKEDVLDLDPQAVVMLMGTNDLEEHASPDTVASNVRLILQAFHAHDADMPIVLCLVMPSSQTKSRPAAQIKRINELLTEIANENETVHLVDTWTPFANENGDAKVEEFPDLLHPNQAGYAKWKAALEPTFEKLNL
ncbi:SGNH/GDSL hydrolase family protein [Rhodopirellula sp. P2]|uniref:SGNH/GDSL hydrolase family protein n=1 Tax=Rhodopirellula sp. P2 TaxID=2127060 RepID=UPI0023677473|nr:SGNH/GDSL hydrolase family protein [Rhodopirellula sp. P2]WDQ15952.1 SGNH/GDSL hydrolase family protein [Rhodopirellula sp. P2]